MIEIVLNEREWAERALRDLDLGKRPVETLGRISRVYYADGKTKREIVSLLEDFLIRCNPEINIVKWQDIIETVARNAGKYSLIDVKGVSITENDMTRIKALSGKMAQRLFFTLLCLAKYSHQITPENEGWVNYEPKDIFSLANIVVTSKKQALMINDLWRAGYVQYSKRVDNTNLLVVGADDASDEVMFVSDFRNLGNQYLMHEGGKFIACQDCGCVIRKTNNRLLRCKQCAAEANRSNRMQRYYAEKANQ